MQKILKTLPLIGLLVSTLFFVACDSNNASNQNNSSSEQTKEALQNEDPNQFNWSIVVNDSSTVQMGNVQSTTYLDFIVVNENTGIKGHYTGSGSGKTLNSNAAYDSNSQAGVENSLAVSFTISDPLADLVPSNEQEDDALAPLVPQDEDDILAPLVPNDDDTLTPLTDENQEADYEGAGTITIAPRTAQVEGMGVSATKKLEGQTFPMNIYVYGDKVRIELKTPQGSVYFDGKLIKR